MTLQQSATSHGATSHVGTSHEGAGGRLREWYASSLGQSMLAEVNAACRTLLQQTYGYHALQIGLFDAAGEVLSESDLIHPLTADESPWHERVGLVAEPDALPLSARSLDLIVLMHTLDLSDDPYLVLREVDRVLSEDGHLIVVGFNRRSLWGLMHGLLRWRDRAPWSASFYSVARVQDWIGVLGLRTLRRESVFFAPPLQRAGLLRRLRWLDYLRYVLPQGGGVYVLKARKQTLRVTPLRSRWLPRRGLVPGGLVRPTSGVSRSAR